MSKKMITTTTNPNKTSLYHPSIVLEQGKKIPFILALKNQYFSPMEIAKTFYSIISVLHYLENNNCEVNIHLQDIVLDKDKNAFLRLEPDVLQNRDNDLEESADKSFLCIAGEMLQETLMYPHSNLSKENEIASDLAYIYQSAQGKHHSSYSSIQDMAFDLQKFIQGQRVSPNQKPSSRKTSVLTVTTILTVLTIGTLLWYIHSLTDNTSQQFLANIEIQKQQAQKIDQLSAQQQQTHQTYQQIRHSLDEVRTKWADRDWISEYLWKWHSQLDIIQHHIPSKHSEIRLLQVETLYFYSHCLYYFPTKLEKLEVTFQKLYSSSFSRDISPSLLLENLAWMHRLVLETRGNITESAKNKIRRVTTLLQRKEQKLNVDEQKLFRFLSQVTPNNELSTAEKKVIHNLDILWITQSPKILNLYMSKTYKDNGHRQNYVDILQKTLSKQRSARFVQSQLAEIFFHTNSSQSTKEYQRLFKDYVLGYPREYFIYAKALQKEGKYQKALEILQQGQTIQQQAAQRTNKLVTFDQENWQNEIDTVTKLLND